MVSLLKKKLLNESMCINFIIVNEFSDKSKIPKYIQSSKSARKICYNMYEFICSKRANTFGKLAYKDWISFCAIDPLVFYNDYYGMIDANNDGKLGYQNHL